MYATIQKPTFDLKWAYNNRLLKVGWMKEVRKSFQQKNVESQWDLLFHFVTHCAAPLCGPELNQHFGMHRFDHECCQKNTKRF